MHYESCLRSGRWLIAAVATGLIACAGQPAEPTSFADPAAAQKASVVAETDTQCQCTGTGPGGASVTVDCGASACGSDYFTYSCSASGWAWTGTSCGGTCQCTGTGPGGAPVTVDCGSSACGSDNFTYSCSASGWAYTGASCSGNGGTGGSGGTCQCTGTGPGGASVTVACGASACGSDYFTYSCSASGWSYTGASCSGGGTGGSGGTCQCTGTGPGDTPVTVDCGASACGSDHFTYSCSASGWSYTGASCSGNGGAGGTGGTGGTGGSAGTGPGNTPVTAACGASACGSDYFSYSCSASGWAWTGASCTGNCQAGGSCQPANPCKTGTYSCATGSPVCVESGNQPATVTCGAAASCIGSTKYAAAMCDGQGTCAPPVATACPANQVCSGTDCVCLAPNQLCGGACVNLASDAANCGTCGHSCQGGTCSNGQCQAAIMASGLGPYSSVFGVDASYVYYNDCSSYYTCTPKRIPIGGGTGTELVTLTRNPPDVVAGIGIMGSTLLLFENQVGSFLATVGGSFNATTAPRIADGMLAGFKNPVPTYFALTNYYGPSSETTTWYTPANSAYTTFIWTYSATGLSNFAAIDDAVFWVQDSGSTRSVWRTVGFPPSRTLQVAGNISFIPVIADANAISLMYLDPANNDVYRLPAGSVGTSAPPKIISGNATSFVTEDANGIYWIDMSGNLNRCVAPGCTGNTVMATGQILGYFFVPTSLAPFYQDSTSLYWVNGFNKLMKIAK